MRNFKFNTDKLEKTIKNLNGEIEKVSKTLQKRTQQATNIVYIVATAKRAKISKEEYKASSNQYMRRIKEGKSAGKMKAYYVSDPNATVGVPVDTGALQESIKQEVVNKGGKWQGRIFTDNPYAKAIEYGTSKIAPRSFMRSALSEQSGVVKSIFNAKM
jgi:hypothetical protein